MCVRYRNLSKRVLVAYLQSVTLHRKDVGAATALNEWVLRKTGTEEIY